MEFAHKWNDCPYWSVERHMEGLSLAVSLPRRAAVTASLLALVASGCSSSTSQTASADGTTTSSTRRTTTTTSTSTTSTTAPTTTVPAETTTTVPDGFVRGSQGPEVQAMEQKLADMKFDPGKVDGVFDGATGHAVMAFQKVTGMARTSRATTDVINAIASATEPAPMMADGGPNRVEIDLPKQILQVYKDGALVKVLSVSTGNNKRYCVDGQCAVAVTPGGSFKVNRKIRGLRVSRLGKLYNPLYFNGGIAIHGSPSVPAGPASHGCVRVPMHSSLWLFDAAPSGTSVYVLGGKKAPVPFGEEAPPEEETTTTTAAPTTTESTTTTMAPTTTQPTTTTTAAPPPTP